MSIIGEWFLLSPFAAVSSTFLLMRKYFNYTFCLLLILSINACSNNTHADIDASLVNTYSPAAVTGGDSVSTLVTPGINTAVPLNNSSTAALNPPHGQPGHDCAIPVGQPLNGKSATAAPQVTNQIAPQIINAAPQITPLTNNNSAVAINPPHGQPGHDCAVAVGSPLNGKSNASASQPAAAIASPVVNSPTQFIPVSNTNSNVALNPPHGQPGHDCAIAVGQPLKK